MYSPVQDGIDKTVQSVQYRETKPPNDLTEYVDCFWELKTNRELPEDFYLHALPDACVNILLNQEDTNIAGITALRTTYEALNLGKSFHYAGIQFLPGIWQGIREEIADSFVGTPYVGDLPLVEVSNKLVELNFSTKQSALAELVRNLVEKKLVVQNSVIKKILNNIDDIYTVADMADVVGYSSRQLHRKLHHTTGFSPHDLLKELRLQQALSKNNFLPYYTDQSHFIRSFRKATGYTPEKYFKKFDV